MSDIRGSNLLKLKFFCIDLFEDKTPGCVKVRIQVDCPDSKFPLLPYLLESNPLQYLGVPPVNVR